MLKSPGPIGRRRKT